MTNFDKDSFSLKGKVALITGGAEGLGRNYSIALSMYGADIFIVSRTQNGWDEIRQIITDNGQQAGFLKMDITEVGAAEKIVQSVIDQFGHLDILVNNAGMQIRNDVLAFEDADWQKVINLNLNALYYLSHEAAKVMTKQKSGKIINIGSMQSYRAGKFIFPYTASKHAVLGLTKAYADALAPYNIQVNGLAPGYIKTNMTKALQDDPVRGPEIKEHIPSGEWGVPEELMGPMVFLASQASDYVTGVMLPVDGGYLLR
ncbi:SDR family NAD(P)-dependent oxidoreductase [Lentilactobacillus buchneri]|uniref:2-deoxy-D-gluconate 3-dehydrogenase n=1 Tax=Lentilactobacillus buchneri DSM 20057 TaxID=1423728 RepID=A0A4R5NRP3_LENBU|nr:SDR family NAD(P)-dependent oxidoreductase [Lentilactobacillus buchneri]KRK69548.1 2-deoxy-D-gluconate 3-dehydrogenase [Lentilactobacillus buchneri DSM 20057]MCT2883138.1 SDR family oxidoreductase [Lentilactobacillus buchneri]MCT2898392.1 SDR family oxidoreductase [Lentilactobacillus buchneri]MCT3253124.1 SDR family oxidoreductase [Lentilactobacillus buchneri]MCT3547718.1 SDR family oxidoreductase [Lentilactobacillus buchneri]